VTGSRLVLVAHQHRADADRHIVTVRSWCERNDVDFSMPGDDVEEFGDDVDVVVSLGGDGTMLRSVRLLGGRSTPLIGVNLGSLGYLTEIEPDDIDRSLDRFLSGPGDGEWHLDERMMLDVAVNGSVVGRALNEAVVEKNESGHTVRMLARIDGVDFTHYEADGLIVSTPTGSTAYSLSARGPILSPGHRAILLTPVSPHMLFDRSLVLSPNEVVEIEVKGHRPADLVIDGRQSVVLAAGDVVRCSPSEALAGFVRFGAYRYHQILKSKFGLLDR